MEILYKRNVSTAKIFEVEPLAGRIFTSFPDSQGLHELHIISDEL